jgi:hypothetical protein
MGLFMGSPGTITRRLTAAVLVLGCTLAVSAAPASPARKPLPKPVPVANDALARALAAGRLSPAEYALERARSLFDLGAVRREFGDVARPDPHDATLVLRDLAIRLRELPAGERRLAERLLARPSDGPPDPDGWTVAEASASPVCDAHVCIHWVSTSKDAPPAADGDSDGIPNWVEHVVQPTFVTVWTKEIGEMGNPAPLSDDTSVNDGGKNEGDPNRTKLDVYLAELGDDLLFGYCTSDDPNLEDPDYPFFAFSAYCVLDNDFDEFGSEWTPTQFNRIVSAHEFRHASQFAEDAAEDLWLMEGEAMWIEGEVYPAVTDRFDYLETSPLGRPGLALDHGADFQEYGAWVFFRYLSERFDAALIRQAWELADGSGDSDGPGPDGPGPDQYSMQAVGNATATRGTALPSAFTTFAQWNRTPWLHYEEGADYPFAPLSARYTLGPGATTTGVKTRKLRHLASAYYAFKPASNAGASARLRVLVDLPQRVYKPAATLLVFLTSGAPPSLYPITLDSSGNGARTVPFGRRTVARVDLVLTNASARYDLSTCWTGSTYYSCGGAVALDELRAYRFNAKLR